MAVPRARVAYLTSEYPAISHTFIQREVAALRDLGYEIETCSIRRTDPAVHHRGLAEKDAAESTYYVISAAKNVVTLIGSHLSLLGSAPGRWLRTLALAWKIRPPGLRALFYQLFYFIEAGVLARHLQSQNIDHLHNHFGASSCTVAMLASEMSAIPYSFTLHGPLIFFEVDRWALREKIARASFVACISHFCRSQAMLFSDTAHWDRLRIVHCGVDPDRYGTEQRHTPGKNVLFVGRLAAMKGVPILIDAFAQVLERHPDAQLTLIGDGDERGGIEARAGALGLRQNVTFAGYRNQDEVADALKEADVFALPSFAEGVPVVLMEAMASRLPVVATRIAGISELVEDGVTGRMVAPGDTTAFANAICGLLDDPARARRMGDAGRSRIEADYASLTEAARLGALFQETQQGRVDQSGFSSRPG